MTPKMDIAVAESRPIRNDSKTSMTTDLRKKNKKLLPSFNRSQRRVEGEYLRRTTMKTPRSVEK